MKTNGDILPLGQHPFDSGKPDIDQLAFALERIQTFLIWIDEHQRSFEKDRFTDPKSAESELSNLRDSTEQAAIHFQRLKELLLAGYTLDKNKQIPRDLNSENWTRWIQILFQERKI